MAEYIYVGVYNPRYEQLTVISCTEESLFTLFPPEALDLHILFFVTVRELHENI
jgi:hypothetical protein